MGKVNTMVFTGAGGTVFLDGKKEAHIKELNVKATGDFEDIEICGEYEKQSAYTGYDVEGDMTVYMTDTSYIDDTCESFKTGVFPERTIVSNLTNKNTNKTANYSIPNVTFTEATIVSQKKGVIELSIPFKCGMPKKLS